MTNPNDSEDDYEGLFRNEVVLLSSDDKHDDNKAATFFEGRNSGGIIIENSDFSATCDITTTFENKDEENDHFGLDVKAEIRSILKTMKKSGQNWQEEMSTLRSMIQRVSAETEKYSIQKKNSAKEEDSELQRRNVNNDQLKISNQVSIISSMLLQCREQISIGNDELEHEYNAASQSAKVAKMHALQSVRHYNGEFADGGCTGMSTDGLILPQQILDAMQPLILSNEEQGKSNDDIVNSSSSLEHDSVEALKIELETKFEEIRSDVENDITVARMVHNEKFGKSASGAKIAGSQYPCDGWDENDHIIFLKIVESKRCDRHGATSCRGALVDRAAVLQMIQAALSNRIDIASLKHHWEWWDSLRTMKTKINSAEERGQRRRSYLLKTGLKQVQQLREDVKTHRAETASVAVMEAIRLDQGTKLRAMRAAREEAALIAADREAELLEQNLQMQGELSDLEVCKRNAIREAIREYRELLKTERDKKREETAEAEREQGRLQAKRMEHNIERVVYRDEQREAKKGIQKAAILRAATKEKVRIERLNSLASNVPYFDAVSNATSDIHKATNASKNSKYIRDYSDLASFQQGMAKMHCFSNERVFSDIKFKLSHALHEAGVAQSAYARAVMKQLIPRDAERTTGIEPF